MSEDDLKPWLDLVEEAINTHWVPYNGSHKILSEYMKVQGWKEDQIEIIGGNVKNGEAQIAFHTRDNKTFEFTIYKKYINFYQSECAVTLPKCTNDGIDNSNV